MDKRYLRIIAIAAALSAAACSVDDTAPREFSFDRITIANPLHSNDEK